jgi:hypothetical protein
MKPWYQYVLDGIRQPVMIDSWSLRHTSHRFNRFIARRLLSNKLNFVYCLNSDDWKGIYGHHEED